MGLGDGSLEWGPGTEPLVGISGQSPGMVLAVSFALTDCGLGWNWIFVSLDRGAAAASNGEYTAIDI